ncbi:MAG: class I SAM-dependent methyltransferase [Phycisphaerae bacterium]|nr:class I SAM-dependent methyltransferase [Phycisphaerae bacterium]
MTWTTIDDGDLTYVVLDDGSRCEPLAWRDLLATAARRHGPNAAIVAKRVAENGTIVAMGERCVHPKGLHSVGHGLPQAAHRFPEEVDGAMGGVAVFPTDLVRGLAPPQGAFGLLHWCLEARLRGGRVIAVPEVRTVATRPLAPIAGDDLVRFVRRFGFHPFAPDIDAIAARPELAALRWNVRFFGTQEPFEKYADRGAFHWTAYAEHQAFRARADHLVRLAADALAATTSGLGVAGDVLDIGCGDGLYAQLLADRGFAVLGVDDDEHAIRHARELAATRPHPAHFERGSAYRLPCDDRQSRGAILLDVLEHLHNPSRALAEIGRVLSPGAPLVVATPEAQFGHSSDPIYHADEFTMDELQRLVTSAGPFAVESAGRIGGPYRDLVVTLRRLPHK